MIAVPVLACLLMAAHFSRAGFSGLAVALLLLPVTLLIRKRWPSRVMGVLLLAGSVEWVRTGWLLAHLRMAHGMPWVRR